MPSLTHFGALCGFIPPKFSGPRFGACLCGFVLLLFALPVWSQSPGWMPRQAGIEVTGGGLPAGAMSAVVRSAHGLEFRGAAARLSWPVRGGGWRLRAGMLDIKLQNGNYLARGYGYDDVQYVWFEPIRFFHVQADRWFDFARTGAWTWFFSAGAAAGALTGRFQMQNAQGCRASNWRRPDTDPAWGGCYHDPDPYGSDTVKMPPAGAYLHLAAGIRRFMAHKAKASFEAGIFLPGFAGFSLALEWNFR